MPQNDNASTPSRVGQSCHRPSSDDSSSPADVPRRLALLSGPGFVPRTGVSLSASSVSSRWKSLASAILALPMLPFSAFWMRLRVSRAKSALLRKRSRQEQEEPISSNSLFL